MSRRGWLPRWRPGARAAGAGRGWAGRVFARRRLAGALAGLAIPVAVAAAGGGVIVVGAGPAAAATSCSVFWTGQGAHAVWSDPKNWNTGHVPGAASDVCITQSVDVTAPGTIRIHSLEVGQTGQRTGVFFTGTPTLPSHVTIATTLDNVGTVALDNSTLSAARVDNQNLSSNLTSEGISVLTSPAFHNSGDVGPFGGRLTLTDSLPQLRNGTLNGGNWGAEGRGVLVLPADITAIGTAQVAIVNGAINDPAGHRALSGLASIGATGSLDVNETSLTLTGNLAANGNITVENGGTLAVGGTLTLVGQAILGMDDGTVTTRTVSVGSHASVQALGTVTGDLVNDGTVFLNTGLAVTGNYTQGKGATLLSEFGSELHVTGKATLAGQLSVPTTVLPGDRAPIVTFAAQAGGFTSHSLGVKLVTRAHEIDVIAQPQIAVSPTTVAPGGQVTLTSGDFGPQTTVKVFLDHTGGTPLATASAGNNGDPTIPLTIPSSVRPGSHKLIAVGSDGRTAKASITVS